MGALVRRAVAASLALAMFLVEIAAEAQEHADERVDPANVAQTGGLGADRSVPAAPHTKRFVPTFTLGLGGQQERLVVDAGGAESSERRSDLRLSAAIGLAHPVAKLSERAAIDGHGSVGFGPTLHGGRYQLPLREDVSFAYAPWGWLTVRGGLGAGVVVDLSRTAMSYAELGVPVGVTLFGALELLYRPYLSLPLGSEDRAVFGGSRSLSADAALVPFDLALRFRFRALGF